MTDHNTYPSKGDAESLLLWAESQNPGPWVQHSQFVAKAAGTIADAAGLDADKAYVLGLLHDIGRYAGIRDMYHVVAGYNLMVEKGYLAVAGICMTHSFPIPEIGVYAGKNDCADADTALIGTYLQGCVLDDYDRLIQLCDSICTAQGVSVWEIRQMDIIRRYGFNAFTLDKWDKHMEIKSEFESLIGHSLYKLFWNDVVSGIK